MPELESHKSVASNVPPPGMELDGDMRLPPVDASGMPKELNKAEMAEQVRRMFAFVLQTPEVGHDPGKKDPELWMHGADWKKLAAFAKEELDRCGRIPFTVLYVLKDFWNKTQESRDRISSILGFGKVTDNQLAIPDTVAIDDKIWLRLYKKSLNMNNAEARRLIIDQGRETARDVVVARFSKESPLHEDEIPALENMIRSITDVEFIRAILPFAEQNPWVALNLLNNFALVNPKKRIKGLAKKIDFTKVITNLLESAEKDEEYGMELASGLSEILSNTHVDQIVTQVKFKDVVKRVMSDPVKYSNMSMALLSHPEFNMESIYYLTKRVVTAYEQGECDIKCVSILIEISGYLSKFMYELIQKVYKEASAGHIHRSELKKIISDEEFETCRVIKSISAKLNRVDNANLCKNIISEAYEAARMLRERGSKTLINKFYKGYIGQESVNVVDSNSGFEPVADPIAMAIGHGCSEKVSPSSPDTELNDSNGTRGKPKRKSEKQKNKKPPRKALATHAKAEKVRLAKKREGLQ